MTGLMGKILSGEVKHFFPIRPHISIYFSVFLISDGFFAIFAN